MEKAGSRRPRPDAKRRRTTRRESKPVVVSHQYSSDTQMQMFTSYRSIVRDPSDDDIPCCLSGRVYTDPTPTPSLPHRPVPRPVGCLESFRSWLGGKEGSLWALITVHVSLVVYAFCYQVEMDTVEYGMLIAAFCAVQLFGGVLFGRAGDVFGSKTMLVVAHLSAVVSYILMSEARSKVMLFVSDIPGLLQHGMQGSSMLVVDMSDNDNRIKALGRLGFSYGIGAIVGPLVVSQMEIIRKGLDKVVTFIWMPVFKENFRIWSGYAAMLWLCIAVTTAVTLLIITIVPTNRSKKVKTNKTSESSAAKKLRNVFSCSELIRLQRYKFVRRLLVAKFGILFPSSLFMSMFAQFCVAEFRFGPRQTGRLLSYVPLVRMVGQGLIVNPLVKVFSETFIIRASCLVIAASMLLIGQATTEWELYLTLLPLNLSGAVSIVVISG
ncbi:hypothetical protein AAMO2058_000515800, partial [Amorphochlora amoebiformis]